MFLLSDNILFSTDLIPKNNPKPGDWWYYFPLHGQHISFYTKKALSIIGEKFDRKLISDGKSIHLFTKLPLRKLSMRERLLLRINKNDRFLRYKLHKQSLLMEDFEYYKDVINNED